MTSGVVVVCECGCGEPVRPGRRFVHNHHWRGRKRKHQEIAQDGDVAWIDLGDGNIVRFDSSDIDIVSKHIWRFSASSNGDGGYVVTEMMRDGVRLFVRMHRLLLGVADGVEVDHVDRDGLNNVRSNIRISTRSGNNANKRVYKNNTLGFKGVRKTSSGKWAAQINIDGKRTHLGSFESVEDAARAFDRAAIEHYGEFASTNESEGVFS